MFGIARPSTEIQISGRGDGTDYATSWSDSSTVFDSPLCPPVYGHQADHAVKYAIGTLPPTPTPTPTGALMPTQVGVPTPVPTPDLSVAVSIVGSGMEILHLHYRAHVL